MVISTWIQHCCGAFSIPYAYSLKSIMAAVSRKYLLECWVFCAFLGGTEQCYLCAGEVENIHQVK